MATIPPDFSNCSAVEKTQYNLFFEQTNSLNIKKVGTGNSLTKLVSSAKRSISLIERYNPIFQFDNLTQTDRATTIRARQWEINNISNVKRLIAQAIIYKKQYYEKNWLGKITKIILKCFNMWNNGNTSSITEAEDFLLFWDSRVPLYKKTNGNYDTRFFWPLIPVSYLHDNLDLSHFYNYSPLRTIEFTGNFHIAELPSSFVKV